MEARAILFCSLASSTRRSYDVGTRRWLKFCEDFAVKSPTPAQEGDLCLFVAYLARSVLHGTIRSYLYSVRSFHIDSGLPDPLENTPLLHRMIRGVKRIQGDTKSKPKFPVTLALLERIHSIVDWSDPDQCMMFAAWSLASGGLLRIGEFTTAKGNPAPLLLNRNLSSVRIDGGFVFRVLHLDASKADPFRKGVDIVLGHSTSPANALVAFSAYDRARAASAKLPSAPLFAFRNGTPLSRELCMSVLKATLDSIKMDTSRFGGLSFRRGGAQSLRDAGVPDHLLQVIGRWASDAYKVYLTTAPRHIAALAQRAAEFTKAPICIAGPVYSPAL